MSRSSPFILDRAIPLYPGLACFLDFLPGVDPEKPRSRKNKKTGKISEVSMTTRGMVRALVLTQLDHRLQDNPADRDLLVRGGARWYARSYESWHWWDFKMFMSRPTMTRAFQDLAAAGYILRRNQTDFLNPDMPLAEQNAVKKVMHVYNGLAWGIDYQALEAAMASNPQVQAYYAERTSIMVFGTSDQPDQTRPGSDQADQTPRISLIARSDQPDRTSLISLIARSDQPDQRSAESYQTPDQIQTESSAAAEQPESRTGAEDSNKRATAPPDEPAGDAAQPLYLQLDNDQRMTYATLVSHHVDPKDAADIVQRCQPKQIDAWLDYVRRANMPGSNLPEVRNPGGYLVKMLEHPDNYPRPEKKKPTAEEKFLNGPLGSSSNINH